MASAERIRDHLPSLYRPDRLVNEGTLLAGLIDSVGGVLDTLGVEAGNVMQAHWSRYADSALLAPYSARYRAQADLPPLVPGAVEVGLYPYLDDLPRIGALLGQAPWHEPLDARETVEQFRLRLARLIQLYRDAIGTREGLRQMTLIALPVAQPDAPEGLRERSFTVEEEAPSPSVFQPVTARGKPKGRVGPLMRWTVDVGTRHPVVPELYITGVAPQANVAEATLRPQIERFDPATGTGVGIAYDGSVEPGVTLAVLPAFRSLVGGAGGLAEALAEPGAEPADPTASGPWSAVAGFGGGAVTALAVTAENSAWAAVSGGVLRRLDRSGWSDAISGLPEVHCLLAEGLTLWVGHANGLSQLDIGAATLALDPDPAGQGDAAVFGIARGPSGTLWLATATGAATFEQGGGAQATGPGEGAAIETALHCVFADRDGDVYFGGDAGVFLHRPVDRAWFYYSGASASDTEPDWIPWDPALDPLPTDDDVHLPGVRAILRGPLGRLWLGTDRGIAVYRAKRRRNTYSTLLEAFPQFGASPVRAIAEDARQRLWFATDSGLVVFDHTDWHQAQGGTLTRLPRPPEDPLAFSHWRFDRAGSLWQRFEGGGPPQPQSPQSLVTDEPAVAALAWLDGAVARLGTFDGAAFTADDSATPGALTLRYKPVPTRIAEGGVPAVPRVLPGVSDWRYLRREDGTETTPGTTPAWTSEGRLLPPPDAHHAPFEGRFLTKDAVFDPAKVFAFLPAAEVAMRHAPRAGLSVTVRLARVTPDETVSDAVLDRLWKGLNQVRPAGARIRIAVGQTIVRGEPHG